MQTDASGSLSRAKMSQQNMCLKYLHMYEFNTFFYLFCSGYNLGIELVDPLVIREEQRSYETGICDSAKLMLEASEV